jgi:hypothetical protein
MLDPKHCSGCHNDFYNHNREGGCWFRADAKLVSARDVPSDMRPPYLGLQKIKRPGCWNAPRVCRVTDGDLDNRGYWRA